MATPVLHEHVLKESEAKFRALAEASPAAIFIAQNGRITYANPMLSVLTGREPRELIDSDPVHLLHPDDRDRAEAQRDARPAGHDGEPPLEVRLATRSGEPCWVALTSAQVVHERGVAIVGTAIDITERKRLESRIEQRQRLEVVGRLAGGVAHDFNNLLTVINGETELLLGTLSHDSPLRRSVEAIGHAAARAASLTQQLLAFGRRQMLIASAVDLNEVIAEAEALLTSQDVTVLLQLDAGLPPVRVDRERLEQVLLNLTANAREAMGVGGALTVTTDVIEVDEAMREGRPWLPDGIWVRLQVADTGPGIPSEVLPHVFEPFFSTKDTGPATGLGLSTVYGIVKQSEGFVWIESEAGAGTRVTILLPPADVLTRTSELHPRTTSPAVGSAKPAAPRRPRILMVEDEETVRTVLSTILASNGFEVVGASSAEEATGLLDDGRFDLMLTDVMLPGMNGAELARRARERVGGLPVLFMSGYTGDAVSNLAEFGDTAAFIQKPFGSRALVARLRALLPDAGGAVGGRR